jgi:hypothetical protein
VHPSSFLKRCGSVRTCIMYVRVYIFEHHLPAPGGQPHPRIRTNKAGPTRTNAKANTPTRVTVDEGFSVVRHSVVVNQSPRVPSFRRRVVPYKISGPLGSALGIMV